MKIFGTVDTDLDEEVTDLDVLDDEEAAAHHLESGVQDDA